MDQYPQQANYPQGQSAYPQQPGMYPSAYATQSQPEYPPVGVPPYPGQPQTGYPAQSPRRSRTGMWVAITVIIILLLGGGVAAYILLQNQGSPTATLQTFCDGYQKEDAQEVYSTFTTGEQASPGHSVADLQSNFNLLAREGVKINSCTVSNVQQNGSTAIGTITISYTAAGVSRSLVENINLIQQNGQWKINNGGTPNSGS